MSVGSYKLLFPVSPNIVRTSAELGLRLGSIEANFLLWSHFNDLSVGSSVHCFSSSSLSSFNVDIGIRQIICDSLSSDSQLQFLVSLLGNLFLPLVLNIVVPQPIRDQNELNQELLSHRYVHQLLGSLC